MIISERFKENVKWLCGTNGINYRDVERCCHLPLGSIDKLDYNFNLDQAYMISIFFNTTVDDLITNDYYIEKLNRRIEELEAELEKLQSVKYNALRNDVGLPTPIKTPGSVNPKRIYRPCKVDSTVAEFFDAGFFEVTNNDHDWEFTDSIYEIYAEIVHDPISINTFGRQMRSYLKIDKSIGSAKQKMKNGKLHSVIYGIRKVNE